jgi:predicted O-methyltransferase YrrM
MESYDCLRKGFEASYPDFPKGTPFWYHNSFRNAMRSCSPTLKKLVAYLPSDLSNKIFLGQADIETLQSSYKDHGFGFLFYALVRLLKPELCCEIGVLHGFSLLTVAAGLRDNGNGAIHGYDLFDEYPYHHDSYENVSRRIKKFGLSRWASVHFSDAFQVAQLFNTEVDYLHIDISNDGDTYCKVFEQWNDKVRKVILLEGGAAERDRVEWMVKYKKGPISDAIDKLTNKYSDWNIFVLELYPSLTVAIRKNN